MVVNELNASASSIINSAVNKLNLTQEESISSLFIVHVEEVFAYVSYWFFTLNAGCEPSQKKKMTTKEEFGRSSIIK